MNKIPKNYEITEKQYDSEKFDQRIQGLTKIYNKYGFKAQLIKGNINKINPSYTDLFSSTDKLIVSNKEGSGKVADFIFYPTHKILEYDGESESTIGYRIKCERISIDNKIQQCCLNLSNASLQDGEWVKDKKLKENGFKASCRIKCLALINSLFENFERNGKISYIVIAKTMGWVQGDSKEFHYPPIAYDKESVIPDSSLLKLNYKISEDISEIDSYADTFELLFATPPSISIPLLSFTILSSIRTIIKKMNSEAPNFILTLVSNNEGPILANLFCSIYQRSKYLETINTDLFINTYEKTDFLRKVDKLRDAVLVSKIERKRGLRYYFDEMNKNVPLGFLLISSDIIKHDSVLNLDSRTSTMNINIIEEHRRKPFIFSTWFYYFIRYLQDTSENKESIFHESAIDSLYQKCFHTVDSFEDRIDLNLLRHYSWLLVGFSLFLSHGLYLKEFTEEEYQEAFLKIAKDFSSLCAIKSSNNEFVHTKVEEIKDDVSDFLLALDRELTDNEIKYYVKGRGRKSGAM